MGDTLQEIVRERESLLAESNKRAKEYAAFKKTTDKRLAELETREAMLANGIDLVRLDRAGAIIDVTGKSSLVRHGAYNDQNRIGVREQVVADAKADIASGGNSIRAAYFGVKNYAHFGDQRNDSQYGFGPRHGSIVFRIGMTWEIRKRLREGGELTNQETEDALYLLASLPVIEQTTERAA